MEATNMKAAKLMKIGDFQTVEESIPVPHGQELLIKVGACGLCGSCLTENYAMCEDYDYLGSRRDGGFAQYCLVPSAWHFVPSHNEAVPMEVLAMTEPACVAQHAVRKGDLHAGANVLIFGAGPIGIMAGRWAKIGGAANVLLVDVVEAKAAFAREHGMDATTANGADLVEAVKAAFGGKLADIVIEGTGFGSALENGIHCCKRFGTVVLLGNPAGATSISKDAHSQLLRRVLVIKGIWNSRFGASPINEWEYTVAMMDAGTFTCQDLITHRAGIEALPELVNQIHDRTVVTCKTLYVSDLDA